MTSSGKRTALWFGIMVFAAICGAVVILDGVATGRRVCPAVCDDLCAGKPMPFVPDGCPRPVCICSLDAGS